MPAIDLTLIHAPAVYDFRERSIMYGPVSDMVPSTPVFEMYPLGFITIGEYLERHGLSVRLYNLASMMLHKPGFDVERNLARLDTRVFGIDLHWMPHCQGSIEVARLLKKLHPHIPIVFGGLSSTIFADELITYDCVDYVLQGDSTEEPFRRLVQQLSHAARLGSPVGDLSHIPNLVYKDATSAIQSNPFDWVPSTMDAISLDYTYPMKGVIRHRDFNSYLPTKEWLRYPVCASLTSRGCDRNCLTCGGSHTAYARHFARTKTAWRAPELLIRDIEHIQRHIWGPIFVLNDFLQAGPEYTQRFITGLKGKLRNPIGFEFFGPPAEGADLYKLLSDNLPEWSVEISAESHDDKVRAAFGKGHYTTAQLEQTIVDALAAGCQRFDLYFMTGIPTQTRESILETGEYVRHLYELVGNDPRLLIFTSPMAPFLDVGSLAFDDAASSPTGQGRFYQLRARTLAEHRERMVLPSWKHIMNYESNSLSNDDLIDATYQAALDINQVKGEGGIIGEKTAHLTHRRIVEAREQMQRLDEVLAASNTPLTINSPQREAALRALKEDFERLSESTVAEKSDLNWPHKLRPVHIASNLGLGLRETARNAAAALRGHTASAASDFDYPDQENC